MTITILYLTMVQVCNILHKQSQSDLTKIEGVAVIFAILSSDVGQEFLHECDK